MAPKRGIELLEGTGPRDFARLRDFASGAHRWAVSQCMKAVSTCRLVAMPERVRPSGFCTNIGLKVVTGIHAVYVAAMIVRARHVLLAWLVYGVLQLGLLGVPPAMGQLVVGSRNVAAQASGQSVSVTKRLFASKHTERTAPTPFAPSATVIFGLANAVEPSQIGRVPEWAPAFELVALSPARAPPVLV